jgi:Inner membrane protein YgaP-like, transmembrane domain
MKLSLNVANFDRVARIVLALVLAALAVTGVAGGALAIVAWVLAAILTVTAVVGFCPIYAIFRISTRSAAR